MKCTSTLLKAAILFAISIRAYAYSIGSGSCVGGKAAVDSSHLTREVVTKGGLQDGNRILQIDGIAMEAGTPFTLDAGENYSIKVVSTEGPGFRGALIRIQSSTFRDNFSLNADGSVNVQPSINCKAPVYGVTHTNAELKTSFGGVFRTGTAGSTTYTIDVTIVDINNQAASIYWHNTFSAITTAPAPNAPSSPATPASSPCFSSVATVQLESGATVPMHHLALGDRVMVDHHESKYEVIYAFAKRNANMPADYLRIGWDNKDTPLEISPKHMLLAASANDTMENWRMLPASQIQIGDKIRKDGEARAVRTIQAFQTTGAYAPLTFSGQIVVDGVMTSAYVSYQSEEYLWLGSTEGQRTRIALNAHWLAHAFLTPIRWIGACVSVPLQTDFLTLWLPVFFGLLEDILLYVYALPVLVSLPVVLPVLALMGLISAVENVILAMINNMVLMTLAVIPMVTYFAYNQMGLTMRSHIKKSI